MAMRLIERARELSAAYRLARNDSGFLRDSGWFRSRLTSLPIDLNGKPIPWMTYSSLRFLEPRLRSDMHVFEYGAGSSTLWWASRVARVVSCEHDRNWYERVRAQMPANVELSHVTRDGHEYSSKILEYHNEFDIVVIDGRDRVRCARNTLGSLKPDGVVLWDNSERDYYAPGYEHLVQHGFRRIDFTGFGPINEYTWSTSVFYRTQNCIGL